MPRIISILHSLVLMICVTATQVIADSAEPSMDEYAYGVELTSATTDVRRFSLTPIIMKGIERRDLGDVRVFDYYNRLMPMQLVQPDGHIRTYRQPLDFKKYIKAGEVSGYIIERPKDNNYWLESLQLEWRSGSAPKVLVLRIEHSADRKNWKVLKQSEVVSNYRFGNTLLQHNTIDIKNYTYRYLRLVFANKKHVTPVLRSVVSYANNVQPLDPKWITTGKLEPVRDKPGSYIFNTGASITPRLLNLHFDKLNSVLSGSLYRMNDEIEEPQWELVSKNFSSYKVTLNNNVVRSRPLKLGKLQASNWMIVADDGVEMPEEALPDVMVAYPPYDVVYLADGDEPYTLVWGKPDAGAPLITEITPTEDVAVVHRGRFMDRATMVEVVASRRFILTVTLASLALLVLAVAAGVFYYRRSRKS